MQSLKLGYYISVLSHSVFPDLSIIYLLFPFFILTAFPLHITLFWALTSHLDYINILLESPIHPSFHHFFPLQNQLSCLCIMLSVTESINSPANLKYWHVKLLIFQPNLLSPDLEHSISFLKRPVFPLLPPCVQYLCLLLHFDSHHLSHLTRPNCFLLSHIFQPTF